MHNLPHNIYSHYSIKESFCHIKDLVVRAKELGYTSLVLTDKNSLSGCPEFVRECTKHEIKPILGCEYTLNDNASVTVIARNKNGWKKLIKLLGKVDESETINVEHLIALNDDRDLILFSRTTIDGLNAQLIFDDPVYYVMEEDHLCQQIITCLKYEKSVDEIDTIVEEHPQYKSLLTENRFFLRSPDEYSGNYDSLVEEYSIQEQPKIPSFRIGDEIVKDPDQFLLELCRKGWVEKGIKAKITSKEMEQDYIDRIKEELGVFKEFGLSTYMLIIWDIIRYAREKGAQVGLRGSAVGCLVSYLTNITTIDPMLPDPTLPYSKDRCLLFSRFINKGRLSGDHISLPDCDLDIPRGFRDNIIEYVEDKYHKENVAHIITFSRLDGRGAIKEIFRVLKPVPRYFDVANQITSSMVDTAKVQDILQDIIEDNPDYTVIDYCIEHIPAIASFYEEYPKEFDLAIKLSKTIVHTGKHAAGIVIADSNIAETFPTKFDQKTGKKIVALAMLDAEYCGAVKYDFLGVSALEKIDMITKMINNELNEPGEIYV